MVPKVAGKGRSFKGAGLYYLHDKQADTRDRVAFTHTENLPTRDPDKAIKCMAWTALRQNELKIRAGGSAKGRKLTQPVYCYSLSWAPGEEPSQEEMITAAKETLSILGLSEHEALFVGHNDEPHPHIHVIVNRVHPETGIAAALSMDHLKLSSWAEEFERKQGEIKCEQRVENNERRRQGEFVKDIASQHPAEFQRWQGERVEAQQRKRSIERAGLEIRHERERADLGRELTSQIDKKRRQVREHFRTNWRDLYAIQAQQRRALERAQASAWSRLRHFVKNHAREFRAADRSTRLKMLGNAFSALFGSKKQFAELERKQQAERRTYGKHIKQRAEQLVKTIKAEHQKKVAQLREKQGREQHEQQMEHSRQSQEHAKEIRSGRDREVFAQERREARKRDLAEQKKDVTKGPERDADHSLQAKFQKARGRAGGLADHYRETKENVAKDKGQSFKENADDLSRDVGRERSRKPKGPSSKPD